MGSVSQLGVGRSGRTSPHPSWLLRKAFFARLTEELDRGRFEKDLSDKSLSDKCFEKFIAAGYKTTPPRAAWSGRARADARSEGVAGRARDESNRWITWLR